MKTIEEKAKSYAEQPVTAKTWGIHKQALIEAYLAGAREALSGQWHDAKTDPPTSDDDVLVAYKDRYADTIEYGVASFDKEWFSEDDFVERFGIFAWMPIPEPPKDERE